MKKRLLAVLLTLVMVLVLLPTAALAADSPIRITKTDIKADSVFNTGGYGSLLINGWNNMDDMDIDDLDGLIPPQIALIDRSGKFVFPYREDSNDNFFADGARFRYSDGIVSLTLGSAYNNGAPPQYYNLNGSAAFTLKETENKYTDENGVYHEEQTTYLGSPMIDGYTVVIKKIYSSWSAVGAGGGGGSGDNVTQIINQKGEVTYELPSEFNEYLDWGAGGFSTKKSLGWCGEGLFAFFEHTPHEDWSSTTEGQGYMDPTGKTVIDLTGQGYTNLFPFQEGLAAVKDQAGKVGFINKAGTQVIPCVYEARAGDFCDGLCAVQKDGKWGYIDKTGNVVIPFAYDNAYGAGSGLASVVVNGKCGLVDYSNNIVVPMEYDDISSYEDGVAYGIKDGILYLFSDYTAQPTLPEVPSPIDAYQFSAWAKPQVTAAFDAGLVPENVLNKDLTAGVTRAQFAAVAVKLYEAMSGEKVPAVSENPFNDTNDPYVLQAYSLGLVGGTGSGGFNPNGILNREMAATLLSNVFTKLGGQLPTAGATQFADDGKISPWARDAVAFMSGKGIINGSGGSFTPGGNMTGEGALTLAVQMLQNLEV